MKHSVVSAAFAALLALVTAVHPTVAAADTAGTLGVQGLTEEEAAAVQQVVQTQTDDLMKGDFEAYASYWADDAVLMPMDHPRINGQQDIVTFVRQKFKDGTVVDYSDWDVVGRDDLAVVSNNATITLASKPDSPEQIDQIIVLRRHDDGRWLVQAAIWDFDVLD